MLYNTYFALLISEKDRFTGAYDLTPFFEALHVHNGLKQKER